MNTSLKAPIALGLTLFIPLFALPAHGAPANDAGRKAAQYRVVDFANARAFVGPATPVWPAPETDGLSRKDEECKFGCIDH